MLKLYSTGEVARRLSKSTQMIHKYVKEGKLSPFACCAAGKQPLFDEQELVRFEQQKAIVQKLNNK